MMPWDEISKPSDSASYSVRLAEPDHPYDFYWGRDNQGNILFRFLGSFNTEPFQDVLQMQGIEVSTGSEKGSSHLTLKLENTEDTKIFYLLCRSLIDAGDISQKGNDEAVARILITHLQRWQRILQNRKNLNELSANEQAGLFGELLILRDIFLENLGKSVAVSAWTGPLDDEQDFSYGNNLLEVKTSRASRDRKMRISSVDQLDSVSGQITLAFVGLSEADANHENAVSLNGMVSELRDFIADDLRAMEIYETRLTLRGYNVLPAYDQTFFVPVTLQFFKIEDSFPRLCSHDIPQGVTDVSYSIAVESCSPWRITTEQVIERIMEQSND